MSEEQKIDKKMLLEDLKFPLHYDGWSYVWDKSNRMVAMFIDKDKEFCEGVTNAINVFVANIDKNIPMQEIATLKEGEFLDSFGNVFLITRGWGRLQYKSEPEKRQDNISRFILHAINSITPTK